MKTLFLGLTLFLAAAQAQHQHVRVAGDRPATHGMLVFGTSQVYLSHLPMFSTPHDYQVIVAASFEDDVMEKYLKSFSELTEKEPYHTIQPQRFVLPDMIASPKPFLAELVAGHFERGEFKGVAEDAKITLAKKPVYFKKFDPEAKRDEKAQWILFGNEDQQFLAHKISEKPDFDQVFSGSVIGAVAKKLKVAPLVLSSELTNEPVQLGDLQDNVIKLKNGKDEIEFSKITQIYLETGDLQ